MTKTITITVLAALALLVAAPEAWAKSPEELFSKAAIAEKEGRLEEAAKLFTIVVEEWPEDPKYGAEAHIRLAGCLAKQGKHEKAVAWCRKAVARFPGHEKLVARAKMLEDQILLHVAGSDRRKADERVFAEALAKLEATLKEKGLRGEELEREFARQKQRLIQEIEAKRAREAMDRAEKLWDEIGLTEEEAEKRRRQYEELRARQAALQAELERLKAEAAKVENDREGADRARAAVEAARQAKREALRAKEEAEWRRGRDQDLEAARREFQELGKRLGIPPEAVERLLADHAGRRMEIPTVKPHEPKGEIEQLKRHLQDFMERLHAMYAELDHRLNEVGARIEQSEMHREARFEEVMKRIERLEQEVRRPR